MFSIILRNMRSPAWRCWLCAGWAVVWVFALTAATLSWTAEGEAAFEKQDAFGMHVSADGSVWDALTSLPGDTEESDTKEEVTADVPRRIGEHGTLLTRNPAPTGYPGAGLKGTGEGRIWLLNCSLKLDC
jgi:hypothetical protein